ncbi:MAG: thiamine-phosphate kinase [Gammaproteobacteria bacterium]|jgi:thiamine-monophosphate kinase
MSLTEFQSIRDYFSKQTVHRTDVELGIGDDCALLSIPQDSVLAVSVDVLVSGVHFPEQTSAEDIGYKSLAVSLSDIAAMGAEPAWLTLAIALPSLDEAWLDKFCQGLFGLANRYNVQLVGGDTTTGPLVVTTHVAGYVAKNRALRRNGAKPGELVYVTGTIGEAGLGLKILQGSLELPSQYTYFNDKLIERLNRPTPRVEIGKALVGIATAAIDISDGVAADLNHILEMSQVGARLQVEKIPVSDCFPEIFEQSGGWEQILAAGDDYELLFTAPQGTEDKLQKLAEKHSCNITCIGRIEEQRGLRCYSESTLLALQSLGYEHFK